MIKETTTFKDLEGNSVTEELYFHLTQLEATELALELSDDDTDTTLSQESIAKLMEKRGRKGIMEFVKLLVRKAYGIKGDDNKSFIKNEQLTEAFVNSLAYSSVIMELLTNDAKASNFINGVIPAELAEQSSAAN